MVSYSMGKLASWLASHNASFFVCIWPASLKVFGFSSMEGKEVSCVHIADAKRKKFIQHLPFSLIQSHHGSIVASKASYN